jgi:hypothetical protein
MTLASFAVLGELCAETEFLRAKLGKNRKARLGSGRQILLIVHPTRIMQVVTGSPEDGKGLDGVYHKRLLTIK